MVKYIVLLFLSVGLTCAAQPTVFEGAVKGVTVATLYKIPLPPELKKHMTKNYRDLRIMDSAKKEIPFVVVSEALLKEKKDFVAYEITSQKHYKEYSEIIIKNSRKDKINNIAFNINNSDAYKYCAVEGSDDGKQWYSVSALQELSLAYNTSYTDSYKCIYFPVNNYLFFRLKVEDWEAEPLKINSAGYFVNSVIAGKLNPIRFKTARSEDSQKKVTLIQLSFDDNQQVDRIDFKIKSPRLFMRHVVIYANRTTTYKNKTTTSRELLFEFELSSNKPLFFDVPALNEKELFIEIENKDNPPLVIDSIDCQQLESYLVCDLDKDNHYTLQCGNAELKSPDYDLINFVSNIPQLLPVAVVNDLKPVRILKAEVVQKPMSFFETKEFLWLCLAVGGAIVLIFSMSLLKDMNKKS